MDTTTHFETYFALIVNGRVYVRQFSLAKVGRLSTQHISFTLTQYIFCVRARVAKVNRIMFGHLIRFREVRQTGDL